MLDGAGTTRTTVVAGLGAALLAVALAGPAAADPPRIVQIALGANHSCALDHGGYVWCWGDNLWGQLGDGSRTDRPTPVMVHDLGSVVALAAGDAHSCAATAGFGTRCWGANWHGQLGDGTTRERLRPVAVAGIGDVAALAVGRAHSCGITATGAAFCWGDNGQGQLGDGTVKTRLAPAAVRLGPVATLAAGHQHSCGITAAGEAFCWGSGDWGQLGIGSTPDFRKRPAAVRRSGSAVALATGRLHSCAVTAGDRVRCWGANEAGQLGIGDTADFRALPAAVKHLGPVTALAAGDSHACAVTYRSRARCWGANHSGQIGDGTRDDRPIPVAVKGLGRVTAVAAGLGHSCALTESGRVRCWGGNGEGQLGDGSSILYSATPVDVVFPDVTY